MDNENEIVISGISGRYPNSRNVSEFQHNLYNKVDMCDDRPCRWPHYNLEVPKRMGKIYDLEKFDARFFGIENKLAEIMSPQMRILLEVTIEAILDAGVNPTSLEGSKTGVFIGCSANDPDYNIFFNKYKNHGLGFIGNCRNMLPNCVSNFLKLFGPSMYMDSACSAAGTAIHQAMNAIKCGDCDAAIIGGVNLLLNPHVTHLFFKLGTLSVDGYCRPFDNRANGYAKSETISVIFVQKLKDARRIHASIVHTKIRCDGYKIEGITHPSTEQQMNLLTEFYDDIEIKPFNVKYVELHGTGTIAGDRIECKAFANIFSKYRPNPLLIGSVKSNAGHSEAAATISSITKIILAFKCGLIPSNIHFSSSRKDIPEFEENKLEVCAKDSNIDGSYIAFSSYGFGGAQFHGLLRNSANEVRNYVANELPYLVLWSGQTQESIQYVFNVIGEKLASCELIGLLNNINSGEIMKYQYKGYGIFGGNTSGNLIKSSIRAVNCFYKPIVVLTLDGLHDNYNDIFTHLNGISIFKSSIDQSYQILEILRSKTKTINFSTKPLMKKLINLTVNQIAIIDVLRILDIDVDFYIGHGIGEIFCAYASETISKKEALTMIYCLGQIMDHKFFDCEWTDTVLKIFQQILPAYIKAASNWIRSSYHQPSTTVAEYLTQRIFSTKPKQNILPALSNREIILIHLSECCLTYKVRVRARQVAEGIINLNDSSSFLSLLGELFMLGVNMNVNKLYPNIKFPVSNNAPFISSLIKWDHTQDWYVTNFRDGMCNIESSSRHIEISLLENSGFEFYSGHVIDGRCIFPATGYISLIWETFSMIHQKSYNLFSVEFQNIKIFRPVILTSDKSVTLKVLIHLGTGQFEVIEGNSKVVTGFIKRYKRRNTSKIVSHKPVSVESKDSKSTITINEDNFYKITRLCGYEFNGLFKSISSICINDNLTYHEGEIKWNNNWVTYLDGMMQLCLVKSACRVLLLPTEIYRIQIDTEKHLQIIDTFNRTNNLHLIKCKCFSDEHEFISDSVRISHVSTSQASRHKLIMNPLLETYKFIPYKSKNTMSLEDAIYITLQMWMENSFGKSIKVIEIENSSVVPIIQVFVKPLQNVPVILPQFILLTEDKIEMESIKNENKEITDINNCDIIIIKNLLSEFTLLESIKQSMNQTCFLISREDIRCEISTITCPQDFQIISIMKTKSEYLVILRMIQKSVTRAYITINNDVMKHNWVDEIKVRILHESIVIVAEQEKDSGIIGLMNCLRQEFTNQISCIFIDDPDAPKFDPRISFYKQQLDQCLSSNVYRNGSWGTYAHLQLDHHKSKQVLPRNTHCFVNTLEPGNLSNVTWYSGPLTEHYRNHNRFVSIQYASMNFRDVLLATGHIKNFSSTSVILCGSEFSGVTKNGTKIMGICDSEGMATHIIAHEKFTWNVPENWNLRDAATCPIIYLTTLIAFFGFKPISAKKSILIHAGSGGVGLAAIRVAIHYGLRVFATVSTYAKKAFLLQQYPNLHECDIGNSRDCSFVRMIKLRTNGKGVDYVLNSLADEKLVASISCLKRCGVYLEIGKTDMMNNTKIGLKPFLKNISIYTIRVDTLLSSPIEFQDKAWTLFENGIQQGIVRPIVCEEMNAKDPDKIFRYMGNGKHKGKIVIKIRENPLDEYSCPIPVTSYVYFNPNSVIVMPGGLGGFGIELVNWMILRGARKFVLCSRNGIRESFQAFRIKFWKENGCHIEINQDDFTTREGCKNLLLKAQSLGNIEGIFNLAVVLRDNILQNQTIEQFIECFKPKSMATKYLDELSRQMCPNLKYFVVFSSTSCGRGNIGQSNYGMANSIMERIIEQRVRDGFAGKAIQWGPIADVGILAELLKYDRKLQISGKLQQTIVSCLSVLDMLLTTSDAIVSSLVVANKNTRLINTFNLFDGVMSIIGNFNKKTLSMNSTLYEIGMDSIILIEIRSLMEKDFQLSIPSGEIGSMTLADLKKYSDELSKI